MPGDGRPRPRMLILGIGDVASAVAHRLFTAGHHVAITCEPAPAVPRRLMSFADAAFDRKCVLAGVVAYRLDALVDLPPLLASRAGIPVWSGSIELVLACLRPSVIVDARMRKRTEKQSLRRRAPLTIGLGPGFVAGRNVDLAVETSWGPDLGKVIESGATRDAEGDPREIEGVGRERLVYSPVSGSFHTPLRIGALVKKEQVVGRVEGEDVRAPLDGALRGLVRDGVGVEKGAKLVEVDPRGLRAEYEGLGERPARIADGVLKAIELRSGST